MLNQRRFFIALWTILSIGALAMFVRSQPTERQLGDVVDTNLASVRVDAGQGAQAPAAVTHAGDAQR